MTAVDAVLVAAVVAVALIVVAAFVAPILLLVPLVLALVGMAIAHRVIRAGDRPVVPIVARTR